MDITIRLDCERKPGNPLSHRNRNRNLTKARNILLRNNSTHHYATSNQNFIKMPENQSTKAVSLNDNNLKSHY